MTRREDGAGLTGAEVSALRAIGDGLTVTMWGGKPHTSLPKGLTIKRLQRLIQLKAASSKTVNWSTTEYHITSAGRAALASTADRRGR